MAKDGLTRYKKGEVTAKPVSKQELVGLRQVYETQAQIAFSMEGRDDVTFTPSHPKLERAIRALGLPDIRKPEGLAAYKAQLEAKRQEAEAAQRSRAERWRW